MFVLVLVPLVLILESQKHLHLPCYWGARLHRTFTLGTLSNIWGPWLSPTRLLGQNGKFRKTTICENPTASAHYCEAMHSAYRNLKYNRGLNKIFFIHSLKLNNLSTFWGLFTDQGVCSLYPLGGKPFCHAAPIL